MRTLTLSTLLALTLLGAATPVLADDEPEVTREDVERKKEEVREMERKLREQENEEEARRIQEELRRRREARDDDDYDDRRRHRDRQGNMQVWVGVGTGLAYGWVDTVCGSPGFGAECSEQGLINTYIGNFTLAAANGMTLRLRGVRASDPGSDEHVPYETAAMIGARFGRSSWYGLFGAGVLHNLDDEFVKGSNATVTGLAWEVMFAPSTYGPMGLELGFQGNSSDHASFIAFNVGVRFGALR